MKKLKTSLAIVIMALMFITTIYTPSAKAAVVSQVKIVTPPKTEYKDGDRISFTVISPNYIGKVEYRVILWNGTTKKTSELWNTPSTGYYYRSWQPMGKSKFTINWPVKGMEPGAYNLTVLVRKANTKVNYNSFVKTSTFWIKSSDTQTQPQPTNTDETKVSNIDKEFEAKLNDKAFFEQYAYSEGDTIRFDNGLMYFSRNDQAGKYDNVLLETNFYKYANIQSYNLFTALVKKEIEGKRHYVDIYRHRTLDNKSGDLNDVSIHVKPKRGAYTMFSFRFNEFKELGDAPICISLDGEGLHYVSMTSKDDDEINMYASKYYVDLFKTTLKVLVGEQTGEKIGEYVYTNYIKIKESSWPRVEINEEKQFDNVKIKFWNDGDRCFIYLYL